MKYKITKVVNMDIEFVYGEKEVYLTDKNPSIIITSEGYNAIPKHKQYIIESGFVVVEKIEEDKKVEIKKNK